MQDQLDSPSTAASGSGSSGGGIGSGGSVASRLKKMIDVQQVQNGSGSSSGGSSESSAFRQRNGSSSAGAVVAPPGELANQELSALDKEMVRLLGQHLRNMGMTETVEMLIKESGVRLEHPNAAKFRHNVLGGCWDAVLKDLTTLGHFVDRAENLTKMKFMVLEQKYLESLEKGRVVEALKVLREELTPLQFQVEKVHALSTYLMFNNSADLKRVAEWDGSSYAARSVLMEKLQSFLPASVMLPPRRLESLLKQALDLQRSKCSLHNTFADVTLKSQSLLTDHFCNKSQFPCETRQILTDHCDEVWYCQFSHSGRYLATGSKDTRVLIWELDPLDPEKRLVRRASLEGHNYGASYFSWAPDDTHLLVVGPEDGPDLWVWNMEKFELKVRVTHSPEDSLSAVSWFPDGKRFVCGGSKGQFYVCDLEGAIIDSWEGIRVRCLNCKKDNKTVLASDTHHRMRSYVFDDMTDKTVVKEDHSLMYFTLSSDDRYALCNIASQGVHLWHLDSKSLVRRFRGTSQGYYAIFSCFGGVNEEFVSSGSEDANVYVWHISNDDPVVVLKGHSGVVNGVSWNPMDPSMLASCSDDGTVRIWGPEGCSMPIVTDLDEKLCRSMAASSDDSF